MMLIPIIGKRKEIELHPLVNRVENDIVVAPRMVEQYFGKGSIKNYYINDSFLYGLSMRNGNPVMAHVVSSALKPEFRQEDNSLPSGFGLNVEEKNGQLFHEDLEDIGRDLIGAFIMSNFIKNNFNEYHHGVQMMSNYASIALRPIKKRLRYIAEDYQQELGIRPGVDMLSDEIQILYDLCSQKAPELLEEAYSEIKLSEGLIFKSSDHILGRSSKKENRRGPNDYLKKIDSEPELRTKEKKIIHEVVNDSVGLFEDGIKDLRIEELSGFLNGWYNKIYRLIKKGEYMPIDPNLIAYKPLYSATLDKTLYNIYLNDMKKDALERFTQRNNGKDPLSNIIKKLSDSAATIAVMEVQHKEHMISQFRKGSRMIKILGGKLIEELKGLGASEDVYKERLVPATLYLLSLLKEKTQISLERIREDSERFDTQYFQLKSPLEYIVNTKIPALEGSLGVKRRRIGLRKTKLLL